MHKSIHVRAVALSHRIEGITRLDNMDTPIVGRHTGWRCEPGGLRGFTRQRTTGLDFVNRCYCYRAGGLQGWCRGGGGFICPGHLGQGCTR